MNETNPAMTDYLSGTALKEILNRLQYELFKEHKKLGTLIKTEDDCDSIRDTKDVYVLCTDIPINKSIVIEYQKVDDKKYNLESDIASLKKRVKHSKNPMEKKRFEKQLNLAYKRRKLDKRGTSS